jgi:glutamine synthetase adenylyltransferase
MAYTRADYDAQRATALRLLSDIENEARRLRDLLGNADYIRHTASGRPWWLVNLEDAHTMTQRASLEANRAAVPKVRG